MIGPPRTGIERSLAPLLLVAATGLGCATRGDVEILEARLRDRQDEIARLQTQIAGSRNEATVARRDADQLRAQLAGRGERVVLPEQAEVLYSATKLSINGFVTSGLDTNDQPGDDAIVTTIVPTDDDGSPVKLPGRLEVVLRTRPDDAEDQPADVQKWVFPSDELRERWQQDYLAGGFHLELPLLGETRHEKVTLVASLETADGRTFEASHDLEIRTPAMSYPNVLGRVPYIHGGDDPNGNGHDRSRPTRTSDVFPASAPPRYQ